MTPFRPTVRTRTQMTVPGVNPLRFALPPLKMPAGFQSLSVFGLPGFVWTYGATRNIGRHYLQLATRSRLRFLTRLKAPIETTAT